MIGLNRITPVRRSLQRLALLMVPFSEVVYLTNQCSYRLTPRKDSQRESASGSGFGACTAEPYAACSVG
jgi:hypothetical protein